MKIKRRTIFISGDYITEMDEKNELPVGVMDYIIKPFEVKELKDVIERALVD
ncbi:hypothetical protein ACFLQK_00885 [bacterium]